MNASNKANKELARGYFEAFNEHDTEWLSENFTDPILYQGSEVKREHMIEREQATWTGIPDFERTVLEMIAEDDRVAVREKGRGTHLGELYGLDPTGEEFETTGTHVFGVENERIAERWYDWDALGFWEQLGLAERPSIE